MLVFKTGPKIDEPQFKPFEGPGRRASGRGSIGTATRKKQEILTQASIKKLNEDAAGLTKQKQTLIQKRDKAAQQASDLLDMTAPQYDSSYDSPWNVKTLVPHANEIIEERRPGPPIKSKYEGSPHKKLYENMDDFLKQLDKDVLNPKKLRLSNATPVKEAKAIAQNGASKRIQNAIRGKLAKNAMLDKMILKQSKAATRIQSAIRNRNARHELDKSVTARVQRMTDELRRSEGNMNQALQEGQNTVKSVKDKRASTIQAAIRRRQPQQQFRAQQNIATQVGAQTKRILTNKAQIKRFETEISDIDKPATRAATTQRRNERRPIVETGLNILRRNQIKQAEGRPRTRSGAIVENESMKSTASTIAKGPKKK